MTKPKVLCTITWLAPGGGVDEQVKLFMNESNDSFDFHLLTGRVIENNEFFAIPNLKIHVCKWLVPNSNPALDILSYFWLKKFFRLHEYDIINTYETKSSFLTRLAFAGKKSTPLIYSICGVVFNDPRNVIANWIYAAMEASTINRASYAVAVSEDVKEEYFKRNIGKSIPWEVIYSGIRLDRFMNPTPLKDKNELRALLGLSELDKIMVNIGRFSTSKNQKDTILVFSRIIEIVKTNNIKLILIGEGPEKSTCMDLVKKLNLTTEVLFVEFTSQIETFLAISDLNIITSLREGLPRVVVEASLAGVPTVGYKVEGISEIISNGNSGFIVPQGAIEELAGKAVELLNSPSTRLRYGAFAQKSASSKWDHKVTSAKLSELYWKLIGNKNEV